MLVPHWAPPAPEDHTEEPSGRVLARRPVSEELMAGRHEIRLPADPSRPAAARARLRRRRRVIGILTAGLLLVVLGVLTGLLGPAWLLVPVAPTAVYLASLRRCVVRSARAARVARTTGRTARFQDFGEPAPAARPEAVPAPLPVQPVVVAEEEDRGWMPVPLPLPSYLTAPVAPRVSDRDFHEEDLAEDELPGAVAEYGLDEPAQEHRRASGDW